MARRGDLALAFGAEAGFACAFAMDAAVMAASSEMAPSVGFHAAADPDDDDDDEEEDEDGLRRRFPAAAETAVAVAVSSGAASGDRRARLTKANSFICRLRVGYLASIPIPAALQVFALLSNVGLADLHHHGAFCSGRLPIWPLLICTPEQGVSFCTTC